MASCLDRGTPSPDDIRSRTIDHCDGRSKTGGRGTISTEGLGLEADAEQGRKNAPRELTPRLLFLEGINRLLRASDPKGTNFFEDINHHWSLSILAEYWDEQP